ncbi:MAG: hypothetical protein J6X25_00070 [Bacteroidales bacterium]|nr:hypothetical protein [Bacteroidales bacterium]
MVFRVRVTLSGIKGFYRVYSAGADTTLYTLHKQMRADMEFPQDQLIMFKAMDCLGDVVARYGLFDLGSGAVDDVTLAKAVKDGAASFVYFYDVTNRKSVNISIEEEVEGLSSAYPVIVDSKGPNPIEFENGYVAFEDLPDHQRHLPGEGIPGLDDDEDFDDDDEDLDEEEEDDGDEDGKEIYDESEE